jgi:hypothetical protein
VIYLVLLSYIKIYPTDRILSKFTHGKHSATCFYKRAVHKETVFGELIYIKEWYTPLYIGSYAINKGRCQFLERYGRDIEEFLPDALLLEIQEAIETIKY